MSFGMVKTGALIAAIAAGLVVTGAAAEDRGEARGGMFTFEGVDLDGDGLVTAEEIDAAAEARFAEADTDGDGALSAAELAERARARMADRIAARAERMIDRLDANGDGLVQSEEMAARGPDPARFIARFDEDGDGAVSEAEFAAARADRGPRHHGGGMHGERHGHGDRG